MRWLSRFGDVSYPFASVRFFADYRQSTIRQYHKMTDQIKPDMNEYAREMVTKYVNPRTQGFRGSHYSFRFLHLCSYAFWSILICAWLHDYVGVSGEFIFVCAHIRERVCVCDVCVCIYCANMK